MADITLETIDAHAAGEPLRIVTGGIPALEGETMMARRADMKGRFDHLRRALMLEPRGHADMYGAVMTPPATDDGDVGVLFLHNAGYSTMCGHGIVALTTVALERGLIEPERADVVRFDTPAGRVTATAEREGDRVRRVSFENVPSFVVSRGEVEVELGGAARSVAYTLAFGGAFYAYVDAESLGLRLAPEDHARLVDWGRRIKHAVAGSAEVAHPAGASDLDFLYGTIFVGPAADGHHSRNVCIFADGEVDRSPTGTGVSGRAAIEFDHGRLEAGRWITIESILGTTFDARVLREDDAGAIVPEVRGSAWITGEHRFIVRDDDPLRAGFMFR